MGRILVTGSRGFVGSHLVPRLLRDGLALNLADRSPVTRHADLSNVQSFGIGDIGPDTDWRQALDGCTSVIHLAGQTGSSAGPDDACNRVNNLGTQRLAQQAAERGIETLLYLSSVMALVDNWSPAIVTDETPSIATSRYGVSKLRAEQHVTAFAQGGRRGVSLRPPMIYGAGAKGNWRRLQKLAATGLPLPFASVQNRRSLIDVGNLVDAIATVVAAGSAGPSGTYLVSDEEPVSLASILTLLREGRGQPARLLPLPSSLLRLPLRAAGLNTISDSLLSDLEIDSSGFRKAYGWTPVARTNDAIRAAASSQPAA